MNSSSPLCHRTWRFIEVVLFFCLVGSLATACGFQILPTSTPTFTPITPTETPTASRTPTQAPTQTPHVITATSQVTASTPPAPQGVVFLSLADTGHYHLFAYSPKTLPLTRLTNSTWDDIDPALSPDGRYLAYISRWNGYWNLFLLELASGGTIQLTVTHEYVGAPSWSPDGKNLTYETYINGNMDIYIHSVIDPSQAPLRLTQDPAQDMSPVWSPLLPGRQIAFVSDRSGQAEVWIADLDHPGDSHYIEISKSSPGLKSHPAWSPDGSHLAWAATDPASGLTGIYVWDVHSPDEPARLAASGDWPVWQDATHLVSRLTAPNLTLLAGFGLDGIISLPTFPLPGPLAGLSYGITAVPLPGVFQFISQITPTPLYPTPHTLSGPLPGRAKLVTLQGVQVPYPQLNEQAEESFHALRSQVAAETGWDALASLENAYVPLTTPLDPGLGEDWLYTGRAFTINQALIQAGWMAIIREDFGQQTYWRIYLRTTAQDGSQGTPLIQTPWNFAARTGDPSAYENGGQLMKSIPSGYWIDLTALAVQYGWYRLPALIDWRTYYAGARFNELAFTQGLDWQTAMLQLYPPEVLLTPTIVVPPTRTPTITPFGYHAPISTLTPTYRHTSTP